ncbi:MAG: phage tail protein [Acidimicrobiales bacterium]
MIEDPIPGYRFLVTLDPADAYLPPAQAVLLTLVAAGQFQTVSGLSGSLEVMDHAEGGRNDFVHKLPVRHSWGPITLSRGVVRLPGLWYWYQAGLNQSLGARRDGAIVLLTPSGVPAVGWIFRAGLAAKWTGPEMNATEDAIALESLEIAHQGLLQVPLSPPGVN